MMAIKLLPISQDIKTLFGRRPWSTAEWRIYGSCGDQRGEASELGNEMN